MLASKFLAEDIVSEQIGELVRKFDTAKSDQRKRFKALANRGWYVDPEWPCIAADQLAKAIDAGLAEDVDAALVADFHQRSGTIRDRLCSQFPSRTSILSDAFDAHANHTFNLSTPVLLVQAEGLWFDVTGDQLFANGIPTKSLRRAKIGDYRKSLFSAITISTPMNQGTQSIANMEDILNRHAVLHGQAIEYGTKLNSCKAISLVSHISWLVESMIEGSKQAAVEKTSE